MSDKFFINLKKYKLDFLLSMISSFIKNMYKKDTPYFNENIIIKNGLINIQKRITISAWGLSDILYYAIRETNDFHGKEITPSEFLHLYNYYLEYDNNSTKEHLDESDPNLIYRLLIGLSQQQFYYQEVFRIPLEYTRNYELLSIIPKELSSKIDICNICNSIIGFSDKNLWIILFVIFSISLINTDLTNIDIDKNLEYIDPILSKPNISKVIEYYTTNYQDYRKSILGEKFFLVKPIIRTMNNKRIMLNVYSMSKKVSEGPLWIIRDYFNENNSRFFTSEFGIWFEHYVYKLFSCYLQIGNYHKIEEQKDKNRADWLIYTKNYNLLIEQKSSIASIFTKKQYPDKEQLLKYIRNIQLGYKQVNSSVEIINNTKPTIKLVLLYDNFFIPNGLFKPYLDINDDHFFLIGIDEFEKLIFLINSDESKFNNVILEMLSREIGPPQERRDFSQLLDQIENNYILKKLRHWWNISPENRI